MRNTVLSVAVVAVMLSGCGTTPTERGTSGAGIGAAAGGATGALTKKDQVDLGEPAWKQNNYSDQAPAGQQTVRDIQAQLARLGLYGGSIDGLYGPQTRGAIEAYQQQRGLVVDGVPSPQLLSHMTQSSAS